MLKYRCVALYWRITNTVTFERLGFHPPKTRRKKTQILQMASADLAFLNTTHLGVYSLGKKDAAESSEV